VEPSALSAGRRLDRARAVFAAVAACDVTAATLGTIVLRPDQVETVRRVRGHLRRDGGCLLAEDVGTGKTYVALAVAREWAGALVVGPASLRSTWDQAARRANVHVHFASHESLSRGRLPDEPFEGIIVDESHRFRSTSRRHATLARLAAHAPLLMLSATPIQNHARELAGQLALFLGEAAFRIEPDALAQWVVRSSAPASVALPVVVPPRWVAVDADDGAVLHAILALPPPPRAVDAGDGGVLLQLSLVRAWASSRAALVATMRRRRRTLTAIEQCHAEGRLPSRLELRSWNGDDAVQLGFPTLLAAGVMDRERADALAETIERERSALDALARTIERGADPDLARAAALRLLRAAHEGASILAFSEWASTVHAYWSALRTDARVGMLTASEARIASGRLPRDDLLARFAPRAQSASDPPARERITLLLATDLLSEGVNLQDASVVVHLDLPWNPARLAQRLGRIRRPGGAREVASYLVTPPARAALLLRVESRLRIKLHRAERTIGRGIDVLPMLTPPTGASGVGVSTSTSTGDRAASLSAAELRGEIVRRLAGWRHADADDERAPEESPTIAAAAAATRGWIGLLDDGRLIALNDAGDESTGPSDRPDEIVRALASANGPPRRVSPSERDAALVTLDDWLTQDWTRHSCGLAAADSPLRRRVLHALDGVVRQAARHRRASILEWAAQVRRALTVPLPLGLERALDALVDGSQTSQDWIATAATLVARVPAREIEPDGRPAVRALILFG
jgi:superfamily II DNA or RNA helicase